MIYKPVKTYYTRLLTKIDASIASLQLPIVGTAWFVFTAISATPQKFFLLNTLKASSVGITAQSSKNPMENSIPKAEPKNC